MRKILTVENLIIAFLIIAFSFMIDKVIPNKYKESKSAVTGQVCQCEQSDVQEENATLLEIYMVIYRARFDEAKTKEEARIYMRIYLELAKLRLQEIIGEN